jgi:hypothetical protein
MMRSSWMTELAWWRLGVLDCASADHRTRRQLLLTQRVRLLRLDQTVGLPHHPHLEQ